MKHASRYTLLAAVSLIGLMSPARADDAVSSDNAHSFYIRGAVGLNKPQDLEYDINAGEIRSDLDNGASLSAALGYDVGAYTVEVEVAHRDNDVEEQSLLGASLPSTTGSIESTAVMLNGYYEPPTDSKWQPYIGAGIGLASVSVNDNKTAATLLLDDSDTTFAYQGMLGLEYDFTDKLGAFAEYRYFSTKSIEVTTATNTTQDIDYDNHNVLAGVRYSFH